MLKRWSKISSKRFNNGAAQRVRLMAFTVSMDEKTGFPLVKFPELSFSVFWLPVTKIQVEYLVCETLNSLFDRGWYSDRVFSRERVLHRPSASQMEAKNLLEVFVQVTFEEARRLREIWNPAYDLPNASEWKQLVKVTDKYPASEDFLKMVMAAPGSESRAARYMSAVERAARARQQDERTLSHQMLLRRGPGEYVYQDEQPGSCAVYSDGRGIPDNQPGTPEILPSGMKRINFNDPSFGSRYGFRLIARERSKP
jgi:hypothetical protein